MQFSFVSSMITCHIQEYFGRAIGLFSLASPWNATMVGTKVKILKTCLSGLAEIAFLKVSCTLLAHQLSCIFVIKLVVFILAIIMSNMALVLKGQKILI